MTSSLDDLPEKARMVVIAILGRNAPELLSSLQLQSEPSREQRIAVEDILADEFVKHLRPDYEPTSYGKVIDDALGKFLVRWPIEGE